MLVLGIDPGTDQGWALAENNVLLACGLGNPISTCDVGLLVIECPQIYDASTAKADPNLIGVLLRKVGRLEERYQLLNQKLVSPSHWKGQTPKKIHNARVLGRLNGHEMKVYATCGVTNGKLHNVIDAIGLAKWRGERMPHASRERLRPSTRR